jgi:NADPH2:quinone reductase
MGQLAYAADMKAAFIRRTGPSDVIEFGDLPEPTPAAQQCLIRVRAVAVNPIDVYWRAGMVPAKMNFPFILGRDLAGEVIHTGPEVKRFKPGDRVWCSNQGFAGRPGSFAEFAAVDESWLHPTPTNVSDEDIVANALTGITAQLGLRKAGLQAGETLFVNGGTGGVGSCVVQMAKALGARVCTTAGNAAKVQLCRELGADLALNYRTDDVDAALRAFAPNGVHVWWETLREPDFDRTVAHLSVRGRMVLMAGRDARPSFPVGPFYVKDAALIGFAMFNASAEEQRASGEAVNHWMSTGQLRARIDRVLPLSAAAEAHRLQEQSTVQKSGELAGKIVLTV